MLALALAAVCAASPFDVLLHEGAEWRYAHPGGEVTLKVVLVRTTGRFQIVALQPFIDGVPAAELQKFMDLTLPYDTDTRQFAISDDGLRQLTLDLDGAVNAGEAAIAADQPDEPLVFPAHAKRHHWKYEEAQLQHEANGTLETKGDTWSMRWKGKACFAGECSPFTTTQIFSTSAGFVKLCELALGEKPPVRCLEQVAKGVPSPPRPSVADLYRELKKLEPQVTACLRDNDISSLALTVNPDGTLSNVRETNQSGTTAACTVKALSGAHLPAFTGAPRVIEKISFWK
jgi:hypothetical protein